MNKSNQEDHLIKRLMQHSGREMPFLDFEDRLMDRIYHEESVQRGLPGSIRIAWLFFALGLFLGLVLVGLMANIDERVFGIPLSSLINYLQIAMVLVLLSQFDTLMSFSIRLWGKK